MKATFFIALLVVTLRSSNCDLTKRIFAGNKSYAECVTGYQLSGDPNNLDASSAAFIKQQGYPVEEHLVITEDGYVLTMQRIPGGPESSPIFMQHGLFSSSFDFVFSGRNRAIAFFLADKGYDVWLGNLRGTAYSMCHTEYTLDDIRYWNYSVHEHAKYDLPTQITYIMDATNQNVIYLGHSLGCSSFYTMVDLRPDIVSKIKLFIGFSPVVYLYHVRGLLNLLSPAASALQLLLTYITGGGLIVQGTLWRLFIDYFCGLNLFTKKVCTYSIFALGGFDNQFDYSKTAFLFHHYPSSTSLKTLTHFNQVILGTEFRYLHYGAERNLIAYNSTVPPIYNISKVSIPIGIVWSDADYLTSREDIQHLVDSMPSENLVFNINMVNFNHYSYVWGNDARELLYVKILPYINKYK